MWVHIYLYVGFVFMYFLFPQAVEETLAYYCYFHLCLTPYVLLLFSVSK